MQFSRTKLTLVIASLFSLTALMGCDGKSKEADVTANEVSAKEIKQTAPKSPNIIFILADDLGYGDVGVYGQQQITTPNLDQMARQGTMFTDFYAGSAVCAPSRSVLMTGKHLGHNNIRGNARNSSQTLKAEDITVAEVLKGAGYNTGLIGKWGLGVKDEDGEPLKQGFDYFYGFINQINAHNHFPSWIWRNNEKVQLENKPEAIKPPYADIMGGVAKPENRKQYAGDLFLAESLEFIEKNSKSEKPFFLYLAVTTPHANNEAQYVDWAHGMEVPSYGKYADTNWPEAQKGYAAMVDHLDKSVGSVLDKLKALGIDDNTIVMFSSDNGPHREAGNIPEFFDSNGELTGIKRDLTEGGIRVPMIVWGPGHVPVNKVSQHIGYFGDFMATAAEISGQPTPENTDSVSFLPTITGKPEAQKQHDYLYWEFYNNGSYQALRKGKWKAIKKPLFTGKTALYDLSLDESENINVAAQHPELVAEFDEAFKNSHVNNPQWQLSKGKKRKTKSH